MSSQPVKWSSIKAAGRGFLSWLKQDFPSGLECCAEREVERIAKDIGVSASELHKIASHGPDAADLLLQRMAALDLEPKEVSGVEPRTFHDLQRICTMCEYHRRCARDLTRDTADPAWKDYCPNAATLMALSAQPWAARNEW